ncbi:hypothetical protein WJX79_004321 [Trebouxia sp. C0005]
MEIVCTWKAPSLANRLGKASAGFWVKAEVRSTAANVACDGVADTVFPGGKTMEALRMRLAEEDEDCDEKERLNATVACLQGLTLGIKHTVSTDRCDSTQTQSAVSQPKRGGPGSKQALVAVTNQRPQVEQARSTHRSRTKAVAHP